MVIVVEYRYPKDGGMAPWRTWGVYDSVGYMRECLAEIGMTVPKRQVTWPRRPWTWTNEFGGEYRAAQWVLSRPER